MSRRFSINFALFSMFLDAILVISNLYITTLIRPSMSSLSFAQYIPSPYEIPFLIYIIFPFAWIGNLTLFALYDGRKNIKFNNELSNLVLGSLLAGLFMAGILYLSYRNVSRLLFVTFWLFTLVTMIIWRIIANYFQNHLHRLPIDRKKVLIIGTSPITNQLAEQIQKSLKFELISDSAILENNQNETESEHHQDQNTRICQYIKENQVQDVIVALPYKPIENLNNFIGELHRLPIRIWVIPDYFQLALHKAVLDDFAGIPMLDLRAPALTEYQRLMKRAFDLTMTIILLPITFMVMAIIAILIRLDSPGSVLFQQRRVGENGKIFSMFKFRTMVTQNQENEIPEEFSDEKGVFVHKSRNDPRVTRVGKILRRLSLDELPQIYNVLKGEMSLVGPRPELPFFVDRYQPWQRQRFTVPQGMTGWWQVNGRSEKLMHLHTEDDIYYVQNYSIWLDFKILVKTIFVVIKGKGAF